MMERKGSLDSTLASISSRSLVSAVVHLVLVVSSTARLRRDLSTR